MPGIHFRCWLPYLPECHKEQSIACEEDWAMLVPLSRLHERYFDIRASHQSAERAHGIFRARYNVWGDDKTSRLKRWSESVPAQLLQGVREPRRPDHLAVRAVGVLRQHQRA